MHLNILPTSITTCNTQIPFMHYLKNLGTTLCCHVSANVHVFLTARISYMDIRRLSSIRRFQTSTAKSTFESAIYIFSFSPTYDRVWRTV